MVKECNLYLFDEPISNLDEALRSRLRPKINFIPAEVKAKDEQPYLACEGLEIQLPQYEDKLRANVGKKVVVGIRPEDLLVSKSREDLQPITGMLERYEHLGNKVQLYVTYQESTLVVTAPVTVRAKVGQALTVYMDKNKVHLFDAETGLRL